MSQVPDVEPLIEIDDGPTTWRFEPGFLRSTWSCIWGRGCQGILDRPAAELGQGCCSVGAELADADEAMTVSASAAAIPAALWQFAALIDGDDVFSDATRTNTKIVDGACIFLNRANFAGGAGCALHLAAVAAGDSPIDWKPSVCWQLPIRVEWQDRGDGTEAATVRRWSRRDWGAEGATMAWLCTDSAEAYVGTERVVESLGAELRELVGEPVYVRLRRALDGG